VKLDGFEESWKILKKVGRFCRKLEGSGGSWKRLEGSVGSWKVQDEVGRF
jgi:hypothetical protein